MVNDHCSLNLRTLRVAEIFFPIPFPRYFQSLLRVYRLKSTLSLVSESKWLTSTINGKNTTTGQPIRFPSCFTVECSEGRKMTDLERKHP